MTKYSDDKEVQARFEKAASATHELEMKNSTVYNSDDIRALWLWGFKLALHIRAEIGNTYPPSSPPKELVVSYYTRTSDEDAVEEGDRKIRGGISRSKYGNVRFRPSTYRSNGYTAHKLGIVRPSKLYDSPLLQMAAVADDVMYLPKREVVAICEVMKNFYSVYVPFSSEGDNWEILHDAPIRYSDRAKRGSRKDASKRAKKNRMDSIRERFRASRDAIDFAKKMIKENEEKQDELRAAYNKVADSLEISEYDRWL